MENQTIVNLTPSDTHVSKCNARSKKNVSGLKELAELIKSQKQLQPVIFRMEDGKPGILAGQRRRGSALLLEKDDPDFKLKGIEVEVDDAQARAISLTENVSQSAMTEVDVWKSLSGLVKQGWTLESISQVYSIPEKKVRQLLALGECLAGVLIAFEKEDINIDGLKLLAIAPKVKVSEWLKLYRSGEEYPSWQRDIQAFLFNSNRAYETSVALFDVADSGLATIEDMFKEREVFADSSDFWKQQKAAVNDEIEKFKSAGWADAAIVDHFSKWDYVECKKSDGGKVYVVAECDGSIVFHKGYLPEKEYQKMQATIGDAGPGSSSEQSTAEKPEITNAMHDYLLLYITQATRTSVQQDSVLAKRVLITLLLTHSDDLRFSGDYSFDRVSENNDKEIEKTQAYKNYVVFRRDLLKTLKVKANWKHSYVSFDTVFKKVVKVEAKKLDGLLAVLTADLITVFGNANIPVFHQAKPKMENFWTAEQGSVFFGKIRNKKALFSIMENEFNRNTVPENETLKVAQIRENLKSLAKKAKNWVPKYLTGGWYDSGKGTPFEK